MAIVDRIPVIDADTHVFEPYDLWTSRMSSKWGDRVPHVVWSEEQGNEMWVTDGRPVGYAAWVAQCGSPTWYPDVTRRWDDLTPESLAATDPEQRLAVMHDHGTHTQVLYPNVLTFGVASGNFAAGTQSSEDVEFHLECAKAYNDYLTEFASAAPGRFVPIAALPFWDVEQSIAEMHRAVSNGHKGIVFPQFPEFHGQPRLADRHWDRLWAAVQEADLAVNFHIGSGGVSDPGTVLPDDPGANAAATIMAFFMDNARTIATVTCGGICHRFPTLKFVSVESGCSWVPFALQSLDWMWKNSVAWKDHPDYLLPSEFFRRQMYACFFFEEGAPLDGALEYVGPDCLLFETDYPHPASMAPGPTTMAKNPKVYIESALGHLDDATLQKLLHDNAASVYHLD